MEFRPEPVDLPQLVDEVARHPAHAGRQQAASRSRVEIDPDWPSTWCSTRAAQAGPLQLPLERHQVHRPKAAASAVRALAEGPRRASALEVEDTGIGIAAGGPAAAVRRVPAARRRHGQAAPGHRPRAGADAAARRGAGRPRRRAQRGRGRAASFFAVLPRDQRGGVARRAEAPPLGRSRRRAACSSSKTIARDQAWLVEALAAPGYAVETVDHRVRRARALPEQRLRRHHARPAAARHERARSAARDALRWSQSAHAGHRRHRRPPEGAVGRIPRGATCC